MLFAATIVAADPSKGLKPFQYLGVITCLAHDSGSYGQLFEYDMQFGSTAVASRGEVKWSTLDQDCLQWACS